VITWRRPGRRSGDGGGTARTPVWGLLDGVNQTGLACLRPPLYATRFHEGFGTLYTAEYRPAEGAVRYHWPGRTWAQSLDTFEPGRIQIQLGTPP
jgi:predicted choloylglycine hydrolase